MTYIVSSAGTTITFVDDIPLLFWPGECNKLEKNVTNMIKSFYKEAPFPNCDGLETIGDLVQKAQNSVVVRLLNEQIPFNVKVLEVGCGTGQLSKLKNRWL